MKKKRLDFSQQTNQSIKYTAFEHYKIILKYLKFN